jgi:hypothetical protein
MSNFPAYPSKEYTDKANKSKLIRELGEAVMEENGEKACKEMLADFKAAKSIKETEGK